ncbi:hypothetical protein ACFXGA_29855 [Actinosynnema sp. NPDC059335]|uniref:HAAS signaling domain-containing protein n=1 Tax=Actinosynnema sp. NPDC059335 TaxID=3346804 RepID=UPI003671CFB7
MNTQTDAGVRHYLDGMREALADLPAAEVGEIMDDAGAHVAEVAEELGEDFSLAALVDRLGTPRAYAEELRAAAGYPSPSPTAAKDTGNRQAFTARFAVWSLVAAVVTAFGFAVTRGDGAALTLLVGLCGAAATLLVFRQKGLIAEIARLPETVALRDALDRLERSDLHKAVEALRVFQPVWWIVRALLIAAAGLMLYRSPEILLVALALAAVSLPAGPKAATDRRWLWLSLPATAFALGLLVYVLGTLATNFTGYPVSHSTVSYDPQPPTPTNIFVFDKDGNPLTDVHLYDENGRPLNAPWYGCGDDRDDNRNDNRFPRPRVVHDEQGCHEETGVPFAVVMPTMPATTTSSAPSTTAPSTTAPPTTVTTTTTG